jgi:fatty acid desaturase
MGYHREGLLPTATIGSAQSDYREHHLFPTMPSANLARARRLVRRFCAEHGLAYGEDSLVGSYRQTLRHLHAVGVASYSIPPEPIPGLLI